MTDLVAEPQVPWTGGAGDCSCVSHGSHHARPLRERDKENPMEMHVFARACLATLYMMLVLLPYNLLTYLWSHSRRRTTVRHTSTQPGQSQFALKEG
jgi:hypothetical protein